MKYTPLNGAKVLISTDGKKSLAIDTGQDIIPMEQTPLIVNLNEWGIDVPALVETCLEQMFMTYSVGMAVFEAETRDEQVMFSDLHDYINSSEAPLQLVMDFGTNYTLQAEAYRIRGNWSGRVQQIGYTMTLVWEYIPITCSIVVDPGAGMVVMQAYSPVLGIE